jgi:hypothetical protein
MKKILALVAALTLALPFTAVAQETVPPIEAGTVYIIVAVYSGTEWVPVADGVIPPTYVSCQPQ